MHALYMDQTKVPKMQLHWIGQAEEGKSCTQLYPYAGQCDNFGKTQTNNRKHEYFAESKMIMNVLDDFLFNNRSQHQGMD